MKIYLAATAPGNEAIRKGGMLKIPRRLLSYAFIISKEMEQEKVFTCIVKANRQWK